MSLKRDDELHGADRARSDTRGRRWRSGIGRCERSVETGFAAGMFGVLSLHRRGQGDLAYHCDVGDFVCLLSGLNLFDRNFCLRA